MLCQNIHAGNSVSFYSCCLQNDNTSDAEWNTTVADESLAETIRQHRSRLLDRMERKTEVLVSDSVLAPFYCHIIGEPQLPVIFRPPSSFCSRPVVGNAAKENSRICSLFALAAAS